MNTLTASCAALDTIKKFEGLRLKAYLDAVGIPTIGWGIIRYPDGKRVKITDTITRERADELLRGEVDKRTEAVKALLPGVRLNQNQLDALVSFVYNVGLAGFEKSTLIKKIKANPNDPAIRAEFAKWVYAGGQKLAGLVRRRKEESDLYFKPVSVVL